jgi:hypothetical protein
MDKETEIASDFKVGRYEEIRSKLIVNAARTPEWEEVLGAFQRRIRERFLGPIIHRDFSRKKLISPAVHRRILST